jgi:hypothetical protein
LTSNFEKRYNEIGPAPILSSLFWDKTFLREPEMMCSLRATPEVPTWIIFQKYSLERRQGPHTNGAFPGEIVYKNLSSIGVGFYFRYKYFWCGGRAIKIAVKIGCFIFPSFPNFMYGRTLNRKLLFPTRPTKRYGGLEKRGEMGDFREFS